MCEFITKLRKSGYSESTVRGIVVSGLSNYYRKLSADLQGGPRLNARTESDTLARRRQAKEQKDNGWRRRQEHGEARDKGRQAHGPRVAGRSGRQEREEVPKLPGRRERKTVAILMVPSSINSALKESVQKEEDDLQKVLGGDRVRVVEKGGDLLSILLCRSDPWAARRMCGDEKCWTCQSLVWFSDQKKLAKSQGVKMPEGLILPKSRMCRREGAMYSIQCADCLLVGSKVVYQGECSVSVRQRHKQHYHDLSSGLVTLPLVHHTLEVHCGIRPRFVATIGSLEATPLYSVVRESVNISCLPAGQGNLNRCQEWGCPRIPIITVQ